MRRHFDRRNPVQLAMAQHLVCVLLRRTVDDFSPHYVLIGVVIHSAEQYVTFGYLTSSITWAVDNERVVVLGTSSSAPLWLRTLESTGPLFGGHWGWSNYVIQARVHPFSTAVIWVQGTEGRIITRVIMSGTRRLFDDRMLDGGCRQDMTRRQQSLVASKSGYP